MNVSEHARANRLIALPNFIPGKLPIASAIRNPGIFGIFLDSRFSGNDEWGSRDFSTTI
jgi:hypothetical protein